MAMPLVLDVKTKSGKVSRVKLPVEIWQKNKLWSFKHDSTEEIESITLDPDHSFPDNNEGNNKWTAANGTIEKDLILDGYLGTYSNDKAPIKIVFSDKNGLLNVGITDYPDFTVELISKDFFESKRAGLKFQFNESKSGFDMIVNDSQKIPFKRDK
jgi:hypothetical protein